MAWKAVKIHVEAKRSSFERIWQVKFYFCIVTAGLTQGRTGRDMGAERTVGAGLVLTPPVDRISF
jgi:hypothetical protein